MGMMTEKRRRPKREGIEGWELRYLQDVKGMSIRKIAGYYGVSRSTVWRCMKEYGIERHSKNGVYRKYNINEDFFKTWAPDSAWLFGWVLGDGCYTNPLHLRFNLARVDREVLEKFKTALESEHPIKDYEVWDEKYQKLYYVSGVRFHSKQLVSDLRELSFYGVPDEYFSHALRGFFEAEGSVYWNKNKQIIREGHIGSNITQNDKDVLVFILWKLSELKIVEGGSIQPHGDGWQLTSKVNDSISLYHYLYADCGDLFLPRKKQTFEVLLERQLGGGKI